MLPSERVQRLRAFFDRAAPEWAARPFDLSFVEALIAPVGLSPGDRVLDVGCGTGHLLPLLRRAVSPAGRVCALDLSVEMLSRASGAARVCGAAEALPFAGGAFDAAMCMGVFPHFLDRATALSEIRRVLRPGGRMAILHGIGRDRLNALHRQIGGAIADHLLPEAGEVAGSLTAAGFRVEEIADRPEFYRAVGVRL